MNTYRRGDRIVCKTNPGGRAATVKGPGKASPGFEDLGPWYEVEWDAIPGHPQSTDYINEPMMDRAR